MVNVLRYSIIRFRPFPETGEFANVGILAFDAAEGRLLHKLVPRRFRRVTQFFNSLDPNVFSAAVSLLQDELEHFSELFARRVASPQFLLGGILKQDRQSIWVFSDLRTAAVNGDVLGQIDQLYSQYVGRNFVNAEYQEQIMVREVRNILRQRSILGYGEKVIEDEIVPVKFPLVSDFEGPWVIKPISLSQKTTIGVIDHAATWHDRLRLLLRRNRLDRQKVLIPISMPIKAEPALIEAYETARAELDSLNVKVIYRQDTTSLVEFAKLGARPVSESLY